MTLCGAEERRALLNKRAGTTGSGTRRPEVLGTRAAASERLICVSRAASSSQGRLLLNLSASHIRGEGPDDSSHVGFPEGSSRKQNRAESTTNRSCRQDAWCPRRRKILLGNRTCLGMLGSQAESMPAPETSFDTIPVALLTYSLVGPTL